MIAAFKAFSQPCKQYALYKFNGNSEEQTNFKITQNNAKKITGNLG